MATMRRDELNKLVNICRSYDPFTQYIENYNQMKSAEAHNEEVNKKFEEIMKKYTEDSYHVLIFANLGKDTESKVVEFLSNIGVEIEEESKRVWTEEEIRYLIQTNDKVLYGALKKLYERQTEDERQIGETAHSNGVGFNGVDSRFLSSVSEFLIKRGFLTDKQKMIVRKKLIKYNKQLTRIANA